MERKTNRKKWWYPAISLGLAVLYAVLLLCAVQQWLSPFLFFEATFVLLLLFVVLFLFLLLLGGHEGHEVVEAQRAQVGGAAAQHGRERVHEQRRGPPVARCCDKVHGRKLQLRGRHVAHINHTAHKLQLRLLTTRWR